MLVIGLTGGIGSGKSSITALLEQWGVSVVDTDVIAHQLTQANGLAMAAIRQQFGAAYVQADGALDRARMRELVFANAQHKARLEAILHPLIRQRSHQAVADAVGPYVVVVIPLLYENPVWLKALNRVCVIDCDVHTQVQRVMQRSGLTQEVIARIMATQATREQRLTLADDVILNDGVTDLSTLTQRTAAMHQHWLALAAQQS